MVKAYGLTMKRGGCHSLSSVLRTAKVAVMGNDAGILANVPTKVSTLENILSHVYIYIYMHTGQPFDQICLSIFCPLQQKNGKGAPNFSARQRSSLYACLIRVGVAPWRQFPIEMYLISITHSLYGPPSLVVLGHPDIALENYTCSSYDFLFKTIKKLVG